MVVVVLIAVAALLVFPAFQYLRRSSARTGCENNLRRLGHALTAYHEHHGHFPSGYLRVGGPEEGETLSWNQDTRPGWAWGSALLPFLDQKPLAGQIDLSVKIEDSRFDALRTTPLAEFRCPGDRHTGEFTVMNPADHVLARAATNSYAANFGTGGSISEEPERGNGVFYVNSRITLKDLTHGAGTTLTLGERGAILAQTPWAGAITNGTVRTMPDAPVISKVIEGAPVQVLAGVTGSIALNDLASTPGCFFSPHDGVVLFAFADGAARPFSTRTDASVLAGLAARAGGASHTRGAP
jgi:hypothetical protein